MSGTTMKRGRAHLALLTLPLVLAAGIAGCSKGPASKSQEFMDVGMYEQAKIVLSAAIETTPKDPMLHFMLGQCLLATGNVGQAQEAFDRATRLEPDYGTRIGKAYYDQGLAAPNERERGALFALAARYDPSTKTAIADFYMNSTLTKLGGPPEDIERSANIAVFFNPAVGKQIAAAILKKAAEESLDSRSFPRVEALSAIAVRLDPSSNPTWGRLFYGYLTPDRAANDPHTTISIGAAAAAASGRGAVSAAQAKTRVIPRHLVSNP